MQTAIVILRCLYTRSSYTGVLSPVVSGADLDEPCSPGGRPCSDANAECQRNVCRCRQGFFNRNGVCSKRSPKYTRIRSFISPWNCAQRLCVWSPTM